MFKSQSSPQLVVLCFDARIDEASVFFGGGGELVEVYGVSIQHNRRQHCSVLSSIDERKISPMMPQRSSCIPSAKVDFRWIQLKV